MALLSKRDLSLALKRVGQDHKKDRVFVTSPVELTIIQACEDAWLDELLDRISNADYSPSTVTICDVPKGKGGIRPGTVLSFQDQVVFTAIVGKAYRFVQNSMSWSRSRTDCAYQFTDSTQVSWLKLPYACWIEFRDRSLAALETNIECMISTDLAGFYDHISLELLISDLRCAGLANPLTNLLSRCLNRWAMVSGRGIPQGMSASDILAKLYLDRVDQSLNEAGYKHLRYVDDMRIFCTSRSEAKRALLDISQLLRKRGLNLQTAKTDIMSISSAHAQIDGIMPTLKPLVKMYKDKIAELVRVDPEYLSSTYAEELLAKNKIPPPTDLLRRAYKRHFINSKGRFDKTLFHYLLTRLGKAKDRFALRRAVSLLEEHPEETEYVLKYMDNFKRLKRTERRLLHFLESPDAIYEYQHYLVLRFWSGGDRMPSNQTLAYARQKYRSEQSSAYLRSAARRVLARFGSRADIDRIAEHYSSVGSDSERAETLCSIYRMEKVRRNSLLTRAAHDGFLASHASRLVRENRGESVIKG